VDEIRRAGERAERITQQLLTFSRKQVFAPEGRRAERRGPPRWGILLVRILGEDIELVTVLDAKDDRVNVDPGQIEQVVVNLAVNGTRCDARRRTAHDLDAQRRARSGLCDRHVDVNPGAYVLVSVSDTGTGMGPDTLANIFEPFFTTKASKGTRPRTLDGARDREAGRRACRRLQRDRARERVQGVLPRVHAPLGVPATPAQVAPPRGAARRSCSWRTTPPSASSYGRCSKRAGTR